METQEGPAEFVIKMWPWLEANKVRLICAGAALLAIGAVYSLISWQHEQTETSAGEAFTQLLTTAPAGDAAQSAAGYEQLAAKYAGTGAGARAQLQAASILFDAGRYPEAQAQFQKFLNGHSQGELAATAELGLGASLEMQAGKQDEAFNAYQKLTTDFAMSTSVIAAEFALGRISEKQNRLEAAESYYDQAARSGGQMGGTLAQEAQGRMLALKARLAATSKSSASKVSTSTAPTSSIPTLK
jgi:predicted negative regulator of RcsB-dependent stress response